jgi:DNA excision repair protein ERCC-3
MAPKRKAVSAINSKPSKRIHSGVNTPQAIATEDENFSDDGSNDSEDDKEIQRLVSKFSIDTYVRPSKVNDAVSHLFNGADFSDLVLKPDHMERPLWIVPDKARIILESFSPRFKEAESFLINIAEPQSRVSKIHEYSFTQHSLFAAVSVGLTTEDILRDLDSYSKTPLPESIIKFITDSTKSFGKVRLVLKNNKYMVESNDPKVLQSLLQDPIIQQFRIDTTEVTTESAPKMGALVISGTKLAAGAKQANPNGDVAAQDANTAPVELSEQDAMKKRLMEDDDEDEQLDQVHSFEIEGKHVEDVSKRCRKIDLPLTEEYDFRNDDVNANLLIDLKPAAQIRHYQEKALHKMFGNGRARSGIIVLPCGAGKTLVGITAACTIKKGIIVLATSAMSVVQWRNEFLKWSNINPADIAVFTSDNKEGFSGNTGIIISTYSMMGMEGKRAYDSQKMVDFIKSREWGLMLLDEVHVVPAKMFKSVTHTVKAHAKLGLTATLLREDDKIEDLNFIIGPKLYEANWQELSEQGHIAKVQCAEVWCPMTTEFYSEYLKANTPTKKNLLFTMNPRKFQACQFLINYHEKRGDKIIVFSDNVYALKKYGLALGKPYIFGETPQQERLRILENFQHNPLINTIFLSKIGDTSLDLPEATCLIQISSHYGSRRQEAQRLGRILRAKRRNDEGFNAFFYSLVSKDTNEVYYSSKRQAFLVDQGYAFKVITHLQGIENMPDLAFSTPQQRRELLSDVLLQNESNADIRGEIIAGDMYSDRNAIPGAKHKKKKKPNARRTAGMLADFSGGQDMAYAELNKSKNKEMRGKTKASAFLQNIKKKQAEKSKLKKKFEDNMGA